MDVKDFRMLRFILPMMMLLLSLAGNAAAQVKTSETPKPQVTRQQSDKAEQQEVSLPEEMKSRMEIERADKEHQKLVDSAKQLGELSAEVAKSFKESSKFDSQELKKLASIEKLARKILSDSGGEQTSDKSDQNEKLTLSEAVDRLSSASADVAESISKGTRFVVSAAVISNSNEVIRLVQYIRRAEK
jgi:hypothetical protein